MSTINHVARRNKLLKDYKIELIAAKRHKAAGRTHMPGENNVETPIDDCIEFWKAGIAAMEAGADYRQFDY